MDELQISGKRFISARRIARENGYTSDYIGQLIRGGKIVGQKVGRAWYVDAASFSTYLSGEEAAPAEVGAVEAAPEAVEEKKEESKELLPAPEEVLQEAVASEEEKEEEEEELVEEELASPFVTEIVEEEIANVPLRIMRQTEEKESSGLRYMTDDAPSLPEIRSNKKESRIPYESLEEEEGEEAALEPVALSKQPARGVSKRKTGVAGLVLASVAIFIFSAVVSSALTLNLSIHEGNAAAASYSFEW